MILKNNQTNTDIDAIIIFGIDKEKHSLFSYIDSQLDDGTLCYATIALISHFFKQCFNIDLTDTEKVKNTMPYLEKMILRFPIEFSMELEKTEKGEQAEDEMLKKLKDQIPPEMLALIEKRKANSKK